MGTCVICGINPAVGKGEHVWPAWFLGDADRVGPPPFSWSSNGQPLLNRQCQPLHFVTRQRLLVPACRECNGALDTRVEKPAKDVVRRLVPHAWTGHADAQEWAAIGRWFAKILLLATHPDARVQHKVINKHRIIGAWDTPHFSWLVDGSPPPDDLSLWVFRAHQSRGKPTARALLPRTVKLDDGSVTPFHISSVTLDGICVTLAYHPGWPLEHPLVAIGHAWELLHGAEARDLAALPELSYNAVQWWRPELELVEGARLDGTLPPLGLIEDQPIPANLVDVIRAGAI